MLEKPPQVAASEFMSQKWDELTKDREFKASDAPTLFLLCQWYAVIESCTLDIAGDDGLPRVAYMNTLEDVKTMPQISTMKQASAEIRALNKQLGINDEAQSGDSSEEIGWLNAVFTNRKNRSARTTN